MRKSCKSYKKKIESAKTVEEVDAIVSEYEKKNKSAAIGGALAVIAVPLSVLAGQIATGKLKEAGDKMVKDLQDECQSKFIKYSHDSFVRILTHSTTHPGHAQSDSQVKAPFHTSVLLWGSLHLTPAPSQVYASCLVFSYVFWTSTMDGWPYHGIM